METCHACGASMSHAVEWCGQCYAPRGRASTAPSTIMALTRPVPVTAPLPPTVVRTRWRKTATTFGPVGRVIGTLALVIPFIFLTAAGILDGGMTIGGAALWGFVVMPWGLRDVWRAGQLPAK